VADSAAADMGRLRSSGRHGKGAVAPAGRGGETARNAAASPLPGPLLLQVFGLMWTAENHFHSGMTGFRGGMARSVTLGLQSVSILAMSLLCGIASAPDPRGGGWAAHHQGLAGQLGSGWACPSRGRQSKPGSRQPLDPVPSEFTGPRYAARQMTDQPPNLRGGGGPPLAEERRLEGRKPRGASWQSPARAAGHPNCGGSSALYFST
jgi:hypothetical protein